MKLFKYNQFIGEKLLMKTWIKPKVSKDKYLLTTSVKELGLLTGEAQMESFTNNDFR
jgi:hypothetical protein